MSRKTILIAIALLPTACSRETATPAGNGSATPTVATSATVPSSTPPIEYTGRWTGVEGMVLDVAPGTTPGAYRLTMQYDLDHKGSFDATHEGDTLVFERDGKRAVLKPTNGDATGLKYLAGKKDCLTVTSGEGYCRD